MPQGAAGRGFSEKSGRQGKVREEAEQRDMSDHRACLYREGRKWTKQTTHKISSSQEKLDLSFGYQGRLLHENCHGQHEALALGSHRCCTPSKDRRNSLADAQGKLDVLLLSDVHTASSGRFNTSHTTVALEEFVMIVGKMSSIILSPAAQAAWRETGYVRWECKDTGRMVAVGLLIAGVKWRFVSVFAPDRVKPAWVKDLFLEEALYWRDELFATAGRREVQFWAGDWNAHIGRDAAGGRGIGSHLLPSPTLTVFVLPARGVHS